MGRRRQVAILGIVTTATVLLGALMASAATAPLNPGSPEFWTTQDQLDALAAQVEAAGNTDPCFSSVAVDAATSSLVVYRTNTQLASAESLYRDLVPARLGVRYSQALLTARQIQDLARLGGQYAIQLSDSNSASHLEYWGLTDPSGPFIFHYSGEALNQEIQSDLRRFGEDTVEFKSDRIVPLGPDG